LAIEEHVDSANEAEPVPAAGAARDAMAAHAVHGVAATGSSPYSTGGGGVSFAQRVAAQYLASMLTGSRRTEAGELPVRRVSFQTGPAHPVDDLLVVCTDDRTQVTLAVACRATPNFVQSDDATVKLVGSLLEEIVKFDTQTHQVAVAAAGWVNQWEQLATVCATARGHADAESFQASFNVDGRWSRPVRDRLAQFLNMVAKAVDGAPAADEVLRLAWKLLSRLHLVGFAVQGPDESDRTAIATSLDVVAAGTVDGVAVRDRLEVEATRYDATGAVVDRKLLRRDLHAVLDSPSTRSAHAWNVLAEHRKLAGAGVRTSIGGDAARGGPLEISFSDRRGDLAKAVRAAGAEASVLVMSGVSGTGKSALMLSTIVELEAADPAGFEALVVNFRGLPQTSIEFRAAVGMSMEDVLAELSAPCRLLVIDAADAALERSAGLLSDLVLAAAAAGVGVVAVTSDTAGDFVREQMTRGFEKAASTFTMEPLGDEDIKVVSNHFPLLRGVLRDLPASSILRRLVVLDLLARTGLQLESSMGEWECLEVVWSKIVRGDGRPGLGSAEAREQTLLAVAAATLPLPCDRRPAGGLDLAAVDALRRDHLLGPASPYRDQPEFAHDEVRRYATAILLVRSQNLIEVLEAAGVPRWAMSAATLACKGQLQAPGAQAPRVFSEAVELFKSFADQHGARWADVPVEAVLETPVTYECLKAALGGATPRLAFGDVVRVVQQRHRFNGLVDPVVSTPVVRVLLDESAPWAVSKESFELLVGLLQSLALAGLPSGNALRIALRERLLAFWGSFPVREAGEDGPPEWVTKRRRRRHVLDYHVTDDEFVESLALLGPDIDETVEECLRAIAENAPALLAPAVDSPLSARAIALRNPELLAMLMEAYYIDDEDDDGWGLDDGVRRHQGRWSGVWPPFFEFYFGGFWQLFQTASYGTSVRVLNNILNHGARSRVRSLSGRRIPDLIEGLSAEGGVEGEEIGAVLDLDGTRRLYVGDSHVWSWYRGTSVGPYSGMSALLAMERLAEGWLVRGASPSMVVEVLLAGCENLAVPGMLFGLLVRHLEKVGAELDSFLAEPFVWRLEFSRITNENSGLRAKTEGLANLERRRWSPGEVCVWLMTRGGEERVEVLKGVADRLVENGDRLGIPQELTKNWAANLDASRYEVTQQGDEYYLQIVPPPEVQAAQNKHAAYQGRLQTSMRLQNRYWGSAKHDPDYQPPTTAEIAQDLAAARVLLESDGELIPNRPVDAVAQVVRTAVERAVTGKMEALGEEAEFVAQFVIGLALSFKNVEDQRHEGQYFDLGADRAVALALPPFLTSALAEPLASIGAARDDVAEAGLAMAGRASLETRLYLARGCDPLWAAPCDGNPCIHETALNWLIETARGTEIGPWDMHGQRRPNVQIEGDVLGRLQRLDGKSIDIGMLDPALRGLGFAAAMNHCCTQKAAALLGAFLDVQRRAMVVHEDKGWDADYRGHHTLVAARALLEVSATNGAVDPVLEHLDVLHADASLMLNFLHGLAAAGAESERLAAAARRVWPDLLSHALRYMDDGPSPYQDHHWGDWAAAALLPEPLAWTQGLYNELSGAPIDWVRTEDLVDLLEGWLPIGRGEARCVDALIRILRKLPLSEQATRGLRWVADLCIQVGRVTVKQTWTSNDWLKEIRSTAEELGVLGEWQMLVDSMVVAGNEGLAPYSR
jgi:hypothetical protein